MVKRSSVSLLDYLKKPETFSDNPAGYLENQLSHISISLLGAPVVAVAPKPITGEIMSNELVALTIMILALAWELWQNRRGDRRGWVDALEDLLFFGYVPAICLLTMGDGSAFEFGRIDSADILAITGAYIFFLTMRYRGIAKRHARANR